LGQLVEINSNSIRFYPHGELERDYVGVYLELLSNSAEVRVHCDFRLIDQTTKSSVSVFCWPDPCLVNTVDRSKNISTRGAPKFLKRRELEDSTYLRDDRLVIECVVTVEEPSSPNGPNLSQDFANLLDTMEGADVTFKVEGEVFRAYAIVLATRLSVFKAGFYGPLSARRNKHITIEDIQPDVFRELAALHLHRLHVSQHVRS
jgi:speckle-type POZ protein